MVFRGLEGVRGDMEEEEGEERGGMKGEESMHLFPLVQFWLLKRF